MWRWWLQSRGWLQLGAALAAVLAFGAPVPAGAQARIGWEPDDRIIIGDFTSIVDVASDGWRVYAATPNGLISYDPTRQRWGLPLTFEDGYPVAETPSALAWIAGEQALVLGTRLGRLWRVDPLAGRLEPMTGVPGPVEQLVGGELGELYVRTPAGWLELPPGGMFPRPLPGAPGAARPRQDGRLESVGGQLGLDARLRRWPVTAIAAGPQPDEFYAGTDGGGLLRLDARTLEVTTLPYGVVNRAVTALARLDGTLWFGGTSAGRGRASVAAADTGLVRWEWPDAATDGAPAATITALVAVGGLLWAAAGDGLYRLSPDRREWRSFGTRDGLPSERVTALATFDSALWIGTQRGVCLWGGATCGPTLLPGLRVTALSYCSAALWIGTDNGLWRATGAELARVGITAGSGVRVQALACLRDSLYLGAGQSVLVYEPGGWRPPLAFGGRGAVRTMIADGDAVWVGTDGGVARWDPTAAAWSHYVVPVDIPAGPVLGVLPAGAYLWLATPAGAVRLDIRSR